MWLRLVVHATLKLGLLDQRLLVVLAVLALLILLSEIARRAAASTQTVGAAVALQVVLGAHVSTRDHREDELDTEARETTESCAL